MYQGTIPVAGICGRQRKIYVFRHHKHACAAHIEFCHIWVDGLAGSPPQQIQVQVQSVALANGYYALPTHVSRLPCGTVQPNAKACDDRRLTLKPGISATALHQLIKHKNRA
jgi:hypothetical protein